MYSGDRHTRAYPDMFHFFRAHRRAPLLRHCIYYTPMARARVTRSPFPPFSSAEICEEGTGVGGVRVNGERVCKSVTEECLRTVDRTLFDPENGSISLRVEKDPGVGLERDGD